MTMKKNTIVEVSLMYRDGSNYKQFSSLYLPTEMEPEKAKALVEWFATKVYDEEINIVPEDLGLENPREKFADEGYAMNKDDHCWCEITGAKVVDDTEEFWEEDMSFEEFVTDVLDRHAKRMWNVFDPMNGGYKGEGRRGIPANLVKATLARIEKEIEETEVA